MSISSQEEHATSWTKTLVPKVAGAIREDPAFREAFKADPVAATNHRFGAGSFPSSEVKVVRATNGSSLFVLTGEQHAGKEGAYEFVDLAEVPLGEGELSDAVLEYVSAGDGGSTTGPCQDSA
ncbi:MAG: hypothetical protein ACRD19_00335 [Terriglobia bacterium]